jgi:hypothetical protein
MAAALLLALLLLSRQARAAACCLSATSFGVGRLLVWEDAAIGLSLGRARVLGEWDAQGDLHLNPPGYSEGITRAQLWTIVRLHERVQAQAWAPVLVNDRWSDDQHQIAGGLGDVGGAVRVELVPIGAFKNLPSLAMTLGGAFPTGKRVEQTSPPLFAGTTGLGAYAGSVGLESEYAFLPWFVRLEFGLTGYLSFRRSDTGQREQYGPLVQVTLSTGREAFTNQIVTALALHAEWQDRVEFDGTSVPDSAGTGLVDRGLSFVARESTLDVAGHRQQFGLAQRRGHEPRCTGWARPGGSLWAFLGRTSWR